MPRSRPAAAKHSVVAAVRPVEAAPSHPAEAVAPVAQEPVEKEALPEKSAVIAVPVAEPKTEVASAPIALDAEAPMHSEPFAVMAGPAAPVPPPVEAAPAESAPAPVEVAMMRKSEMPKPAAATPDSSTVIAPEMAVLAARADAMQTPQIQILPALFRKVPWPRLRPLSAWPRPDDIVMRDVTAPNPEAECDAALNSGILVAEREQLGHRGACFVPYAVKVRGIMVGRKKIDIVPPAMLRCGFALAVANWVRAEVAPAAEEVGAKFTGLRQLDSYNCRTMSSSKRVMSEHSAGNALDIAEILYADHRPAYLTSSATMKDMRLRLRSTACRRFKTVLGPGVPQHHDHIHIDLRKHFGPGGICHWNVL